MTQSAMVDVVGVGLNATDTLIHLEEFPLCGSKVEYEREAFMPGGQVATAMVACQTWGLRTRYVGKLGDDDAARLHEEAFRSCGVEARLLQARQTSSARSLILVDRHGERTVLCRRDERVMLQPEELEREWVTQARALLVDGHDTAAATLSAKWAREAGVPVVADLDEAYRGVEALIENIDHLIVSRELPERLTGERNLRSALQVLASQYGCALTAATLGPDGVLAWDGERFHHSPAYRIDAVDTTGAGDIFHAGYLYGLIRGWSLERRLDFACAAAALNCTAEGARGGIGSIAAIDELMAKTGRYEESTVP